jgi:hypothetical protein
MLKERVESKWPHLTWVVEGSKARAIVDHPTGMYELTVEGPTDDAAIVHLVSENKELVYQGVCRWNS